MNIMLINSEILFAFYANTYRKRKREREEKSAFDALFPLDNILEFIE